MAVQTMTGTSEGGVAGNSSFDIKDRAELAVAALDVLGLADDKDKKLEEVTADFSLLAGTVARPIETYYQIRLSPAFSLRNMVGKLIHLRTHEPTSSRSFRGRIRSTRHQITPTVSSGYQRMTVLKTLV